MQNSGGFTRILLHELFPCDTPKILDSSLKMKYDISLPGYDEFGFGVDDEPVLRSGSDEIDSGKINPEKTFQHFLK